MAQGDPFDCAVFFGKCVAGISWLSWCESSDVQCACVAVSKCFFFSFYCNSRKANVFRNQSGFLQMFKWHFYFLSLNLILFILIEHGLVGEKKGEGLSWIIYLELELGLDVYNSKSSSKKSQSDGELECSPRWLWNEVHRMQRLAWWCMQTMSIDEYLQWIP